MEGAHTRGGIKLPLVDSNQGRSEEIRMDETGSWPAAGIGCTWRLKMALETSETTNRELKILFLLPSIFRHEPKTIGKCDRAGISPTL